MKKKILTWGPNNASKHIVWTLLVLLWVKVDAPGWGSQLKIQKIIILEDIKKKWKILTWGPNKVSKRVAWALGMLFGVIVGEGRCTALRWPVKPKKKTKNKKETFKRHKSYIKKDTYLRPKQRVLMHHLGPSGVVVGNGDKIFTIKSILVSKH